MNIPPVLTPAAEAAIRTCLSNTALVSGTGETAEVARLVLHLPEALVQAWSPFLAAGELDVLGVFSHKTPRARWTDPRTNKSREPELCDLLLILDCESFVGRTRRALVIQAKPASTGTAGRFSVDKGSPEYQRYLYTHWPQFELTGLGSPLPPPFQIAPQPPGTCPGTRYACVNIAAPPTASGWWVEDAQPSASTSGSYHGVHDATLPLGEALHRMVVGSLGAPLVHGSEWERMVSHLLAVAENRQKDGSKPPDVKATASGTVLPHMAAASLFMTNAHAFFDSKATSGYDNLDFQAHGSVTSPPGGDQVPLVAEAQSPGFGAIYIRIISPEWHEGK